jgi:threonine/homoserine efflux transporter RhtA
MTLLYHDLSHAYNHLMALNPTPCIITGLLVLLAHLDLDDKPGCMAHIQAKAQTAYSTRSQDQRQPPP